MSFQVADITFRYPMASEPALRSVSLSVTAATHVIILGPNGSGKSTLLRVMLGRWRPAVGRVLYRGEAVEEWQRDALAREVGVVPQEEPPPFPMTVRDYVAMGRYPHLGRWRPFRAIDRQVVEEALARCDVDDLAQRTIDALSGGERQRVRVARALAQEPRVLVLDEPTTHLDIRHEMEIFELLRSLVAEGLTAVTVTHNLSLAGRYAEHLVLLDRGRIAAQGAVSEVLRREVLEPVYRWPLTIDWPEDGAGPVVRPLGPVAGG